MKAEGRYVLAEGPVYDERTSTLYFVDILEGKLHIKKDGDKIESISFGTYVTSVHLCDREDCVLATTRDEVYEVCTSTGERRLVTSLSLPHTMRFNDGAVAPADPVRPGGGVSDLCPLCPHREAGVRRHHRGPVRLVFAAV